MSWESVFNMPEKPKRGRPVSGRKIVVQIGLDEDAYQTLVDLAETDDETVSSKGRKLLTDAIQRERKRK